MSEGIIKRNGTIVQNTGTEPSVDSINGEEMISVKLAENVLEGDTLILTDTSFSNETDTVISSYFSQGFVASNDGTYVYTYGEIFSGFNSRVYKLNETTKQYELFHEFDSTLTITQEPGFSKNMEFIILQTDTEDYKIFKRNATDYSELYNMGPIERFLYSYFSEDLNFVAISGLNESTFEPIVKVYKIETNTLTELSFDIDPASLGYFDLATVFFSSESSYFYVMFGSDIEYYKLDTGSAPELVKQASTISTDGFYNKPPTIINDVFYFIDNKTEVFSYDALTGQLSSSGEVLGELTNSYSENFIVGVGDFTGYRIWKLDDPLNPIALQINSSTVPLSITETPNFLVFASSDFSTSETTIKYMNFEIVDGAEKAENSIVSNRDFAYIKEDGLAGETKNVYTIFKSLEREIEENLNNFLEWTKPPTITGEVTGANQYTFTIKNNDDLTATIKYEVDNSRPEANEIVLESGATSDDIVLNLDYNFLPYTLYAQSFVDGKNSSRTVSAIIDFSVYEFAAPTIIKVSSIRRESGEDYIYDFTFRIKNNDDYPAQITWDENSDFSTYRTVNLEANETKEITIDILNIDSVTIYAYTSESGYPPSETVTKDIPWGLNLRGTSSTKRESGEDEIYDFTFTITNNDDYPVEVTWDDNSDFSTYRTVNLEANETKEITIDILNIDSVTIYAYVSESGNKTSGTFTEDIFWPFRGPGLSTVIAGDMNAGFFGEVSQSEFGVTMTQALIDLGILNSSSGVSNEPLLKFIHNGKIKYINKKLLWRNVEWDYIASKINVYGGTTMTFGGNSYKVRLMRGWGQVSGSPDSVTTPDYENGPLYTVNFSEGKGGNSGVNWPTDTSDWSANSPNEWNTLMFPIHALKNVQNQTGNVPDWARYEDYDLGINFGKGTWTQETVNTSTSDRVTRGNSTIESISSPPSSRESWPPLGFTQLGLRLVFELISP